MINIGGKFVDNEASGETHSTKGLQSWVEHLPDSPLKRGLNDYLDLLSYESPLTAGKHNHGLSGYFENEFQSNACFRELAISFYREVSMREPKYAKSRLSSQSKPPLGLRADIGLSAGLGEVDHLKSGWAWERALKTAKGDKNLAVALIGMCGHDDTAQGSFRYEDNSDSAKRHKAKKLADLKTKLKKELTLLENTPSTDLSSWGISQRIGALRGDISNLEAEEKTYSEFACPGRTSVFFVPNSLGVDISESLREKVVSVQAPKMGPSAIPAKYYHVYGSAFLTCRLIQKGVSPDQAVSIQANAARFYRGLRLCQKTSILLKERDQLLEVYRKYRKRFKMYPRGTNKVESIRLSRRPENFSTFFVDELERVVNSNACAGNREQSTNIKAAELTCDEIRKTLGKAADQPILNEDIDIFNKRISTLNAAYLYHKWYLGGRTFGMELPCTDARIFGPKTLLQSPRGRKVRTSKVTGSYCGSGFDKKSCMDARKILATWDIDFQWTIGQHITGAEFAKKHCSKVEEKTAQANTDSCRIRGGLGKSNGNR